MYTKNSWEDGDVIEAKKLNHMEDGIKQNADQLRKILAGVAGAKFD